VRAHVQGPGPDRWLAPEIEAARALVVDGSVLAAASDAVGELE
jgi:histidine ammonia-lyase